MSFVDLATLTMHRRHELESRILIFEEKCDRAINDIKNLKMKSKGFPSQLNCAPAELKDRFLSLMQKLDEYIYLITDFNLAMAQTADTDNTENTPVQDLPTIRQTLSPFNLMDALTEPLPAAPPSLAPPAPAVRPPPQKLIVFSGASSSESVPLTPEKQSLDQEVASLNIEEPVQPASVEPSTPITENSCKDCCITAAQTLLEVDHEYPATIMYVNSCYYFWVIIEDPEKVAMFMSEMTDYYLKNNRFVSLAELQEMTYCAYCDDGVYYRAMFLHKPEVGQKAVNVYVIDTGEERTAPLSSVQPLAKQFCDLPPFARLCHLAGLDFGENLNNKELMQKQDAFMKKYNGVQCIIYVDDNASESLGVFVKLPSMNTTLNQLMVDNGLALLLDKPSQPNQEETDQHSNCLRGPPQSEDELSLGNLDITQCPEYDDPVVAVTIPNHDFEAESSGGGVKVPNKNMGVSLGKLDITQCPEYEDPVVAVTGYHNRDEADICKHYKGGPDKTCFKGARCNKKHILHHPDGWTLDKMEVIAKCTPAELPPVGAWIKVLVTAVCHFDRVIVQILNDEEEEEDLPEFGCVSPPLTLASLVRDMNSPATIQAYKPLPIAPALGEIVAALYPPDNYWYRAKVLTVTRQDQSVEVMYVDYGTVLWVKEDLVRQLPSRLCTLPIQGVQCVLGGVRARDNITSQWALAKRTLASLTHERQLHARVLGREYDEVIIELFICDDDEPSSRQNVAELLAEQGLIELVEYSAIEDNATQKLVVP